MPHYPESEELHRTSWAFDEPIRHRRGFKEAEIEAFCEAIPVCSERWRDQEEIPKVLAWMLANYTFIITANRDVAARYPDDEKQRIWAVAWKTHALIARCFKPSQGVQDEYVLPDLQSQ